MGKYYKMVKKIFEFFFSGEKGILPDFRKALITKFAIQRLRNGEFESDLLFADAPG